MQAAGTSPHIPDTILRLYLHTNEQFQNNFSNVFGTNRLFSDMPVQQHLLLAARMFFVLNPEETCLSLSSGMLLTSSAPSPPVQAVKKCWRLRGTMLGRVHAPNAHFATGLQVALDPSLHRLVPQFPSLKHGNDTGLLSEVF